MAESTMEIQVPITVKGGREGDKVGKQIGDKIAASLNRSLKSVGFGGSKSSASAGGGGAAPGSSFLGLNKGIGKMALKLGVIAGIAGAALGLMKKSSGYLRGVLSVFGRAFLLFFRPFGDFLASMLRPLAMVLMRAAIAWLKFTRTGFGKGAVGVGLGAGGGALAGAAIGALGGPIGAGAGALIGAGLALLAQIDWGAVYDKMLQFGSWLWDKIKAIWDWKENFNVWLWGKIKSIWNYVMDFGSWLWEKVKTVWNYVMDFGGWIWDKIKSIWNYTMDFGSWLWGKIKEVWYWGFDFGYWLWGKITSIWKWNWDVGAWLKSKIKSIFSGSSSSSGGSSSSSSSSGRSSNATRSGSSGGSSSSGSSQFMDTINNSKNATNKFLNLIGYQTGTGFVPETGMYKLHRGESVIPRVNNNSKNNSVVLQPTFQIVGSSNQSQDVESAIRRYARETEMQLKSRGVL